ncbi:hypothetical protein HMPREF9154_2633 [Arachnia propionica F0230a]|nr:hypothetical protein HMPREF9154_2633 [Arachnia propionica F0230a]
MSCPKRRGPGLVVGFVVRLSGVSTRVARFSRPGSTGLEVVKLVEPTCERQRAGRVETMVRMVERAVRCSYRQASDVNDACWCQASVFSRARRRSFFRLEYRQL